MSIAPPSESIAHLIEPGPVRVWSLIVSFFGDAVVPRGGSIALATLLEVMGAFGVDGGAVRTALSRLAKDGWVERSKIGRNAFYRLTDWAHAASVEVSARIYASAPKQGPCDFKVLLIDDPAPRVRAKLREDLMHQGAGALGPNVLVLPAHRRAPQGPFIEIAGPVTGEDGARRLVAAAWSLRELADAYREFADAFGPEAELFERGGAPAGLAALALRVLLIHRYRRLVLRDPDLPAELLPADWPGHRARALARRIWCAAAPAAERWLDAHALSETGALPPLEPWARARFRG